MVRNLRWPLLGVLLSLAWTQREWLQRLLAWLRRASLSGVVVSSQDGRPVAGVRVEARSIDDLLPRATATADADGRFVLRPITMEEIALHLDGGAVGYESGYLGFGGVVVPTWGEAVSVGVGELGTPIRLDPR